ncbi:MAG: OFA family MFS transporter [Gemmatimonadaceae bacterium]|nr:OFA family MFS transporter [Gemmatimonadaceae bacterium]
MGLPAFLHRDHTIARAGFNRWRVPPAALAIHLCIGQAYAFSVFSLPLSKAIGLSTAAPDDWKVSTIGWVFSTAIVFLGVSAALFGSWLERVGPRAAMFAAALCFSSGLAVGAAGIAAHQFWLLLLGYGVLGGIGLGLGYISPVSTLIKWFPDRPGMATGLAIMGFGGGAIIASPLSVWLMAHYRSPTGNGIAATFLTLAVLYLVVMMFGVFTVRVPPADWAPSASITQRTQMARPAPNGMTVAAAVRTTPFWLLWIMLCVNVTAGIGVLGQASAMIQEMFPGVVTVKDAANFVVLLSLANLIGRFAWSSLSDGIGRRATYAIFFALGAIIYSSVPTIGRSGNVVAFIAAYCVILSMYGGGFATIPAYLRDRFGTLQVGAIHGRLLTAWSTAGVLGPVLVNYIREYQISRGVPKAEAYSVTMYLMAALLVIGFIANLALRPVTPTASDR